MTRTQIDVDQIKRDQLEKFVRDIVRDELEKHDRAAQRQQVGVAAMLDDLIGEVARMPDAAIYFAMGTDTVWTPEHLVPLRETVRTKRKAELEQLFEALNERFNQPDAVWMGVFQAGAEMAMMEHVARKELEPRDRRLLRQLGDIARNGVTLTSPRRRLCRAHLRRPPVPVSVRRGCRRPIA